MNSAFSASAPLRLCPLPMPLPLPLPLSSSSTLYRVFQRRVTTYFNIGCDYEYSASCCT